MSGVCPAERIIPIYAFSDRRPEMICAEKLGIF